MTFRIVCAGLAAALCCAGPALAEDNEAGVPLSAAEAAGAWTLESGGHDLCVVTLGARYTAKADHACGDILPGDPVAWQATRDGMQLLGTGGQSLLAFNRWSNSLFVAHRSSGLDVQLKRGASAGVGAVN